LFLTRWWISRSRTSFSPREALRLRKTSVEAGASEFREGRSQASQFVVASSYAGTGPGVGLAGIVDLLVYLGREGGGGGSEGMQRQRNAVGDQEGHKRAARRLPRR
jgi:hypothetical protein